MLLNCNVFSIGSGLINVFRKHALDFHYETYGEISQSPHYTRYASLLSLILPLQIFVRENTYGYGKMG